MKRKKKQLELNQRLAEPDEAARSPRRTEIPAPLVGQRFPAPDELAQAVVDRSVVVLPRVFDWTVVPGPVETQ